MQKSFSFKGLTRNSDDILVTDGECMELVNLKYRDGCLVPFPSVFYEKELDSCYTKVFWHPLADMFFCIESSDNYPVHIYDKDFNILKNESSDSLELYPELVYVERIEFIGALVCCVTQFTTYYLMFDSGHYRWLGERPPMPGLRFSVNSIVYTVTTESSYLLPGASLDSKDAEITWTNVSKGFFDECLSGLHSKGYYVDRALFRLALRLFDGNYLSYSPIYYIDDDNSVNSLKRDDGNFVSEKFGNTDSSVTSSRYLVKVQGFFPTFHFKDINLSAWENVIVGIDVFTTGSIYGHKIYNSKEEWYKRREDAYISKEGFERYVVKEKSELWNEVLNASLFYKVAEYSIDGVLKDCVNNVTLSNLSLCETLPDDVGSMVSRSANYSYVFNGRLHLAGLREYLFKGYNPQAYLPAAAGADAAEYAALITKIKTTTGISVVKKEYHDSFLLGRVDGSYAITPFIMYPDSRAFEMTFIISIGGYIYKKTFPLQQHKNLNLACYLHNEGNDITVRIEGALSNGQVPRIASAENIKAYFSYIPGRYLIVYGDDGCWYYGDRPFTMRDGPLGVRYYKLVSVFKPVKGDSYTIVIEAGSALKTILNISDIKIDDSWEELEEIEQIEEENPCEIRANIMRVSAVDNPFYYPAENTYSPSQNEIIAVCSNTMALSQGQFGQHPLYLFCKDGIWALSSDVSGSVTYASIHPVSREVCINANSICCIDNAVVFIGKKGVLLLQGGSISCISNSLNSEQNMLDNSSRHSIWGKISQLSYNWTSVSKENFTEYVKDAIIGYLANERELWVSNSDYNYSFIYSLENGSWTKINHSYSFFVDKYPYLYAFSFVDDKSHMSILHKDNADNYAPILLFTRPQLWGTKIHKRINQLVVHASIKIASACQTYEYRGFACYVLCSNDGVSFKLLTGVEKENDFNDIVLPFFPSQSYKYYVIAFSGSISLDSKIVGSELSIECVWNNRLR